MSFVGFLLVYGVYPIRRLLSCFLWGRALSIRTIKIVKSIMSKVSHYQRMDPRLGARYGDYLFIFDNSRSLHVVQLQAGLHTGALPTPSAASRLVETG